MQMPKKALDAAFQLRNFLDDYNAACEGSGSGGDTLDADGLSASSYKVLLAAASLITALLKVKVRDEEALSTAVQTLLGFCEDASEKASIPGYAIDTKRLSAVLNRCEIALGGNDRKVLVKMLNLGAVSSDFAISAAKIFGEFKGGDPKKGFQRLQRKRYVESAPGRGGGSWLTVTGIEVARILRGQAQARAEAQSKKNGTI